MWVTEQKDLTLQLLKGHLVMSVEFVLKVGYASQPADILSFILCFLWPPQKFLGDIWPWRVKSGLRNCVQANSM